MSAILPLRLTSFLTRHLPLKSGLSMITNNGRVRRWCQQLAGGHCIQATLQNRVPLYVDVEDYNGRMLYLFGTADPKVIQICRALLQPGDVFLDIGANYGSVGLLCQDCVGESGQVELFEPQPHLCQGMRHAIERMRWADRVRVHEVGLMDQDGTLVLHRPERHTGRASFVQAAVGEVRLEVRVRNAGDYLPPLLEGRPVGIKLDVEGAESLLLPILVTLPNLRFVLFENNNDANLPALWKTMADTGLAILGVQKSLLRVRLSRLDDASAMASYHDVVAVVAHPGRIPRTLSPHQLARIMRRT